MAPAARRGQRTRRHARASARAVRRDGRGVRVDAGGPHPHLRGMADTLTPEGRSALMRRIRGRDTAPELFVRRLVHALGYRYRLHGAGMPPGLGPRVAGRPDLVFPRRRKAIVVHGCFWHGHAGCRAAAAPSSRTGYWGPKLVANRARDAAHRAALRAAGWDFLEIWECEARAAARDPAKRAGLEGLVEGFLGERRG